MNKHHSTKRQGLKGTFEVFQNFWSSVMIFFSKILFYPSYISSYNHKRHLFICRSWSGSKSNVNKSRGQFQFSALFWNHSHGLFGWSLLVRFSLCFSHQTDFVVTAISQELLDDFFSFYVCPFEERLECPSLMAYSQRNANSTFLWFFSHFAKGPMSFGKRTL